ncbi:hypothetical protein QR77_41895, partial [Streptomyces sp. 150FB]
AAAAGSTNVQHARPSSALPATRVQAASAIVPYAPQRRPVRRPGAGFDFFGTQATGGSHHAAADADGTESTADKGDKDEPAPVAQAPVAQAPAAELAKVAREDLADVVGEEALAAQRATEIEGREVGQVIDLTAHDETEQLELGELRSAIGS